MDGARFCSACGKALNQTYTPVNQGYVPVSQVVGTGNPYAYTTPVYTGDGYAVMLVDCGVCSVPMVADLISDTCGYTDADARMLAINAPTLIAQNLTERQAAYLAQCLTEYGAQAAIYDRMGNKVLCSDVDSVFDGTGSFLTKVASALGLIGISNRITRTIRKLTLPSRPTVFTVPRPVVRPVVRRHNVRHPAPMPKMQPPRNAPGMRAPRNPGMNPLQPAPKPQGIPQQPGHLNRAPGPNQPRNPQDHHGGFPGGPGNPPHKK